MQVSLLKILPENLRNDAKVSAAAKALEVELEELSRAAQLVLHLPRLDELPHEVLDQLAEQYHVDFYQPTEMSLDTKRTLIRNSLRDHYYKGTKAAVESLLNKITRGAKVKEWFEYDGRKYFFKVNLQGLLDYGDEGEIFMQMINATKNERSWLDAIDFDLSKLPNFGLFVAQLQMQLGSILADLNNRIQINQRLAFCAAQADLGNITFNLRPTLTKHTLDTHVGVLQLIHGRIRHPSENDIADEETLEQFERYIRQKWLEYKQNPVVEHYKHGEMEGEIDDPADEEYFPVDVSFLRIYWKFGCGFNKWHLRYQTILNPRPDVTTQDIKYLSEVGVAGKILLHSKLETPTTGILRALYVKKTETKVI